MDLIWDPYSRWKTNGLVQDYSNASASAIELLQFHYKPSTHERNFAPAKFSDNSA